MNGLSSWYADLLVRIKELETWTSDFNLPNSVWLPGFFNPQSFLTAIMQSTARKNELPLDKMCLVCEVTKKTKEEMTQPMKEGACINGLYMEVLDKYYSVQTNLNLFTVGCQMGYIDQLHSKLKIKRASPTNACNMDKSSNSGNRKYFACIYWYILIS